jgi:hypothetical protein
MARNAGDRPIGVKIEYFQQHIHHHHPQRKDENTFGTAPFVGGEHICGSAFGHAEKALGSDLTTTDYAALEARWIDRELADRAGLRRVDSLTGGDIVGRKGSDYAGIIIPYFRSGADHVREYCLRRDHPDMEYDSSGNLKPRQKYLSPPGRSNMLYLPPGISQEFWHNASLPVLITGGDAIG